MVSCVECMKKLPEDCTCTSSKIEKIDMYLHQLSRELKLVKAVMLGFTPKIKVEMFTPDGKIYAVMTEDANVKAISDFLYEVSISIKYEIPYDEKGEHKGWWYRATLLDVEGEPLYRQECLMTPHEVVVGCTKITYCTHGVLNVSWTIGIGS